MNSRKQGNPSDYPTARITKPTIFQIGIWNPRSNQWMYFIPIHNVAVVLILYQKLYTTHLKLGLPNDKLPRLSGVIDS